MDSIAAPASAAAHAVGAPAACHGSSDRGQPHPPLTAAFDLSFTRFV